MSPNDKMLVMFSVAFIIVMSVVMVVPILKRKQDVFTAWNFFLLGAIIFSGLSAFNATSSKHYLPSYRTSDYMMYYVGTVVFYTTTVLTYYYWKYPRRAAGRRMRKWPKLSGSVLVIMTVVLALFGVFTRVPVGIPFIGQILFQFSVSTPIIGFACAFIAWYRAPRNVMLLALMLLVGGIALFTMLGVGGSRRYLMSVLAVIPICLYWTWLRYKPTHVIITWIAAAALIGVPLLKGFSEIRHHGERGLENIFQRSMDKIRRLPDAIRSGGSSEGFMGQDSVECALLTIHLLNDGSGRLEKQYFFAPYYVITNPIPRTFWPEKPESLGYTLPQAIRLDRRGIVANLGVNVVGQCYYDGGLAIHLIYGVLCAGFLRFYDELLVRQAGNPLLIGGVVFMAPQIMGFSRGAIDTMGLQIVLGFLTILIVGFITRVVFGLGIEFPRTDHLIDFPVLRSPRDWAKWMGGYTAVAMAAQQSAGRRYDDEDEEPPLAQPALRDL